MKIPGLEGAARDNPDLRIALTAIETYLTALEDDLGINPAASQISKKRQHVAPPPLMPFVAYADSGNIIVEVGLPHDFTSGAVVYHQVRTGLTRPFSDAAQTFAPTLDTKIVIPDPGVTKFVAVRSRFQDSAFNAWVLYPTSITT